MLGNRILDTGPHTDRTQHEGDRVQMVSDTEAQDEPGFRGPQVCKLVGISYRQLDYWARTDLIRPSLCDAQGSGTQRLYSYRDLVALKVIKSLVDSGVSLQTARKAMDYLRENLGGEIASASLVLDAGNSILARTGEDLVDLVRRGQGVLNIVPLGAMVNELDARILALNPEAEGTPAVSAPVIADQRVAEGG